MLNSTGVKHRICSTMEQSDTNEIVAELMMRLYKIIESCDATNPARMKHSLLVALRMEIEDLPESALSRKSRRAVFSGVLPDPARKPVSAARPALTGSAEVHAAGASEQYPNIEGPKPAQTVPHRPKSSFSNQNAVKQLH